MTEKNLTPMHPIAGLVSLGLGAITLLIVLVHFWAGPFAAQQKTTVTVGEIAAEIRQAAVRKLKGSEQPEPVAAPWDSDRVLKLITALLAGVSIIAGVVSLVRRETWRPAVGGIALGTGAIVFQLFTWAILLVAGALILVAIIQNITGILGE